MSLQFFDTLVIDLKKILNNEKIEKNKRYALLESRVTDYVNSMTFYEHAPHITGYYITLDGCYIKLFLELGDISQTSFDLKKEPCVS